MNKPRIHSKQKKMMQSICWGRRQRLYIRSCVKYSDVVVGWWASEGVALALQHTPLSPLRQSQLAKNNIVSCLQTISVTQQLFYGSVKWRKQKGNDRICDTLDCRHQKCNLLVTFAVRSIYYYFPSSHIGGLITVPNRAMQLPEWVQMLGLLIAQSVQRIVISVWERSCG